MIETQIGEEFEAEWLEWNRSYIRTLLAVVPGLRGSQTFISIVPAPMPYLALNQIDDPGVLKSPEYLSVSLAADEQPSRWNLSRRENLLGGLGATPDVPMHSHLLALEDARDLRLPAGIAAGWLIGMGADKTLDMCGLAVVRVVPLSLLNLVRSDSRVRIYRPVTEKVWKAD